MKISVNWLREYVDIDLSVDDLVEKIGAQLGAVEEVIDLNPKYKGIVIAKVVECEKHPNADKLSLCKIDDGKKVKGVERDKDGLVQVVCGAPNVKAGMLVAWLPPGATVPASYSKDPFVLEARELRGKVSNGMLASASELDLGDDHSGIAELSWGEPGDDFAKVYGLDDQIIDVENKMFTHRPDCFGLIGVAREIAGITGQKFTSPDVYIPKVKPPKSQSQLELTVKNSIPKLVPRFMAQVSEGVESITSPIWMQAYLARVGMKPINYIVDVTNYVMYLTGQPLHAYDYDKLLALQAGARSKEQGVSLETRLSRKGDTLKLLNGKTIKFDDTETILITSHDVPVGVGGVMGGADTEVDENTKNIVLECANFDMYAIRRASMRHGLFTDAVTRFNKGQSPLQNPAILYKAGDWVRQYSGKVGITVDEHATLQKPIAVHVTEQFINDRLGLDIDKKAMARLLTNVEFKVAINGPTLAVTPPFWRTDIEIPEDIVEEVGRLYGFDHLPLQLPKRSVKPPAKNDLLQLKQTIRQILSAAGANELLTYNFVHGKLIDAVGQDKKQAYKLSNALSPDLQYYRLSLTPSLLEKVHPNIKAGHDEFALFEIGKAHNKQHSEDNLPKELQKLAFVYANKTVSQSAAYYRAKAYVLQLAQKLGTDISFRTPKGIYQTLKPFAEGRYAEIIDKDSVAIGVVGEYKNSVRRVLKLPENCAGFEISVAKLPTSSAVQYQPLSRYPSVSQDITLKVDTKHDFADVQQVLEQSLANCEEQIELTPTSIFQKDKTHKNYTFHVEATSYKRTLQAEYVNDLLDQAAKAAKSKLGATRV